MEAHGGYTFCGLAALEILGKSHLCNLKALLVSKIPDVSKLTLLRCLFRNYNFLEVDGVSTNEIRRRLPRPYK